MSIRGLVLIFFGASITVAANLLVRMGVLRAGGFSPQGFMGVLEGLWTLMKQPAFGVGMFLYGLASLLWFRIVSGEQLTIAYPILVSLTFLMVTVGGYFFFRESITLLKIAGMTTIVLGIVMVSFA